MDKERSESQIYSSSGRGVGVEVGKKGQHGERGWAANAICWGEIIIVKGLSITTTQRKEKQS